jgi:tetratricopeptide (TPR) repeat protein
VLGVTHPDIAQSLNNLAALYRAQGDYPAALPLFQRALRIYEQALGATHPHTKVVRKNLELLKQHMQNPPQ